MNKECESERERAKNTLEKLFKAQHKKGEVPISGIN